MNTRTGNTRPTIVFVHGFGSRSTCWDPLLKLLQSDREVTERFDFDLFPYPTAWLELRPDERIPGHDEIANAFHAFLDSERFANREITLVGHSQGGLLIHVYLAYMIEKGWGEQLEPIRQVITIATPHSGSMMLQGFRRLLSRFFNNPQDQRLRPLDEETAKVIRTVNERIAMTDRMDGSHWPVPVHCFGGLTDDIVPRPSAQGPFNSYTAVHGNHFTILEPANRDDDRYREFKEVLLDPVGHPHVFEVEHYNTSITVQPVKRQKFTVNLGDGRRREIETDNICDLKRTVHFAKNNQCDSEFKIRYLAGDDSCFEAEWSHANAAAQLESEYRRSGEKIDFLFTPKLRRPGEEYYLSLKIYNGFGDGRRDVHFHLGPKSAGGMAYYRKLTYTLDLSQYIAAGYKATSPPAFYLHREDPGDCNKCKSLRKHGEEVLPSYASRRGEWRWELHNVRRGVVDLFWDIAKSGT